RVRSDERGAHRRRIDRTSPWNGCGPHVAARAVGPPTQTRSPNGGDDLMLLADVALFPDQASTVATSVDRVYYFIIGTTVAVSTVVAVLVIYFAIKYRRRSEAPP